MGWVKEGSNEDVGKHVIKSKYKYRPFKPPYLSDRIQFCKENDIIKVESLYNILETERTDFRSNSHREILYKTDTSIRRTLFLHQCLAL